MALRAGYYGVKRRIWEALQNTAEKLVQDVSDIWANNGITGAKNLLPITAATQTVNHVTATVNSDKSITVDGTASANTWIYLNNSFVIPKGTKVILSGNPSNSNITIQFIERVDGSTIVKNTQITPGTGETELTISNTTNYIQYLYYIGSGKAVSNVTLYPMVRLATDPDPTFISFAMTNQELTASANDQKTAINAIITAATGAADFAAFKAAMEAITPVTRSAAPAERSLDEEEPEVIKKTTRKRTTKTEEEE